MKKKILILVILLAAGLLLSCERDIPSDFNLDNLPAAPKAPGNLRISVGDNLLTLNWEMENEASISRYFIYRSSLSADSLDLYDSSAARSYADDGVQNNIRYYYQVSALSNQNIEGYRSAAASAVAGVYSIAIENDAHYTNDRAVSINSAVPALTTHIMLSNSPDFGASRWLNYAASVSWELSEGDGAKSVYARFKDNEGNETVNIYSDEIILDRLAEIDTFYISGGASLFSAGDRLRFVLDASEAGGRAAVEITDLGTLDLYDNGSNGDALADNGIYELSYTVPPNIEILNVEVVVTFSDRAGNRAPDYTLPYLITISNPPIAPQLSAVGSSEEQIDLAWLASEIDDFNQYRIYRALSSTVSENSELITTIINRSTVTYSDLELEPSTTYYYRLYIYDNSGLSAASNIVNRRTSNNEAPEAVSLAIEVQDSVTFRLTWTRNSDTDFESYRIYRSNSSAVGNDPDDLLVIENTQGTTSFTDDAIEVGKTYYYKVYVYDRFGASAGSNEVYAPK